MPKSDKDKIQLTIEKLEELPLTYGSIILNKERFIQVLAEIDVLQELSSILKSIIVKNFEETRGKRNQKEL